MYTYACYPRIKSKIRYAKVTPKAGALATYLIDVFVLNKITFCAESARSRGLLPESVSFTEWLKALEERDFVTVVWATPFRYISIREGRALHADFNEERSKLFEIATADDVREISNRLSRMERGFERVAKLLNLPCDPPDYTEFFKALSDKEEVPF